MKRALVSMERERAENLSKTTVEAEIIQTMADAALYRRKAEADASYYTRSKESEALQVAYGAQSEGIKQIQQAFDGDNAATLQYIMLDRGLFQELAKANSEAIKGLNPTISVWNTGEGGQTDSGKAIREIYQNLPPLMQIVGEQTGIKPPAWMGSLPEVKK